MGYFDNIKDLEQDEVDVLVLEPKARSYIGQNIVYLEKYSSCRIFPNITPPAKTETIDLLTDSYVTPPKFLESLKNILNRELNIVTTYTRALKFGEFYSQLNSEGIELTDSSIAFDLNPNLGIAIVQAEGLFKHENESETNASKDIVLIDHILNIISKDLEIEFQRLKYSLIKNPKNMIMSSEAIWVLEILYKSNETIRLILPLYTLINLEECYLAKSKIQKKFKKESRMETKNPNTSFLIVDAAFGTTELSEADLGEIKSGDIIILNRDPSAPFEIKVNGKIIFSALPVLVGNKFALRIVKRL